MTTSKNKQYYIKELTNRMKDKNYWFNKYDFKYLETYIKKSDAKLSPVGKYDVECFETYYFNDMIYYPQHYQNYHYKNALKRLKEIGNNKCNKIYIMDKIKENEVKKLQNVYVKYPNFIGFDETFIDANYEIEDLEKMRPFNRYVTKHDLDDLDDIIEKDISPVLTRITTIDTLINEFEEELLKIPPTSIERDIKEAMNNLYNKYKLQSKNFLKVKKFY